MGKCRGTSGSRGRAASASRPLLRRQTWRPGCCAATAAAQAIGDWLRPLGSIDPVIGFGTRNYKPPGSTELRKQELFVGLALDLQAVFDDALGGRRSRAARVGHSIAHGFFEHARLPYTSVPVLETSRSPR